jgi:hypothetical protein
LNNESFESSIEQLSQLFFIDDMYSSSYLKEMDI